VSFGYEPNTHNLTIKNTLLESWFSDNSFTEKDCSNIVQLKCLHESYRFELILFFFMCETDMRKSVLHCVFFSNFTLVQHIHIHQSRWKNKQGYMCSCFVAWPILIFSSLSLYLTTVTPPVMHRAVRSRNLIPPSTTTCNVVAGLGRIKYAICQLLPIT
jgi:hypothetical protein